MGGHDDVGVVRQDDDGVGVHALNGVEQILRRGVHGLSARHHDVDAEALENLRHARAGGDRHEPERLVLRAFLCRKLLVALDALKLHVVDEDFRNLAALQEVMEHLVGRVGVNVHLELGFLANAQLAVAHRGQEIERLILVEHIGIDEEFVAVGVLGALPVVDLLDRDLRSRAGTGKSELVAKGAGLAEQRCGERVSQDGQAEAAGIDHAVLLEHREQVGRTLHRSVAFLDDGLERLVDGELLLARVLDGGGHVLHHREDRALDRLAHRLESDLDRAGERRIDRRSGNLLGLRAALAQTAENLRGDDAGVPARAHESARGDGATDLGYARVRGKLRNVVDDRLQRERHVRAGIAIGNGEHVQAINLFLALAEPSRCRGNGGKDV